LDALAQEFERLAADQYVNRWAVVQLLTDLEDPRALDALIASPLPKERSDDPHGSPAARELVARTTAVEAVTRLAAGGSEEARAALLKYARHPVRSVKIAAALAYLEQGGSRARKELRKRMPKSDYWILEIRRVHPQEIPPIEGHRFLPPKSPPEAVTAPRPIRGGQAAATETRSGTMTVPRPSGRRREPGTASAKPSGRKNRKMRG
jgi:HEAT repeat protein